MYYSLIGRDLEHEIVPFVQEAGIGILAWSPLAGGFLTGKYTREKPEGDGGRLTGFDMLPHDREKSYGVVDRLRAIGAARGASVAQVALAWLLSKPYVSSILVGANKTSQLEDNLAAADLRLGGDELAELDQLTAPMPIYPNWFAARVVDVAARDALSGAAAKRAGS
jgi:aryl-alcohol dehydrogenase-like predicted oxidoreductase